MAQALGDLIFLSHFYGAMILALTRYKGPKPGFPKPHRQWRPMTTVSRGDNTAPWEPASP